MRERPTWLISRAYARANGLLQEGFAQGGGGLRGYHYRLLAALDEWGPASQASLGRGTGIDRSDVTAALWTWRNAAWCSATSTRQTAGATSSRSPPPG